MKVSKIRNQKIILQYDFFIIDKFVSFYVELKSQNKINNFIVEMIDKKGKKYSNNNIIDFFYNGIILNIEKEDSNFYYNTSEKIELKDELNEKLTDEYLYIYLLLGKIIKSINTMYFLKNKTKVILLINELLEQLTDENYIVENIESDFSFILKNHKNINENILKNFFKDFSFDESKIRDNFEEKLEEDNSNLKQDFLELNKKYLLLKDKLLFLENKDKFMSSDKNSKEILKIKKEIVKVNDEILEIKFNFFL